MRVKELPTLNNVYLYLYHYLSSNIHIKGDKTKKELTLDACMVYQPSISFKDLRVDCQELRVYLYSSVNSV